MVVPQIETLRQLHRMTLKTAKTLKSMNFQSLASSSSTSNVENISILDLPFPDDIMAPLLSLEISESMRNDILRCFTGRVTELQQKCNANYKKACASAPWLTRSSRNDKLREAYHQFYDQQCRSLVDSQFPYIVEELAKQKPPVVSQENLKRTTFQREYTPVLENYFEHNAYPNLPDRLLLARKSMMTPRQIEVWFQNHRNRAKKQGIPLKRLPFNIPSTFSFDDLEIKTPHLVIPKRATSTTVEGDSSDDESASEPADMTHSEPLLTSSERPPHAFPQPYAANNMQEPSPRNSVSRFPPPNWQRHSATVAASSPSIDMDELAILFASKLHLRAASLKTTRTSKINASGAHIRKWFSSTVVTPFHVPHPASIRNPCASIPRLASIAIDHEPSVWQRPSLRHRKLPTSEKVPLFPTWKLSDEILPRKTTQHLPRRTPFSMPCRTASHPYLQSMCPRTSSLSSISSSGSRSTSWSSGSSSSPEPVTPPMSHLAEKSSDHTPQPSTSEDLVDSSLQSPDAAAVHAEYCDTNVPSHSVSLEFSNFPSWYIPPVFTWFD